ncbi:hypothetical protein J3A83DRAFT_4188914 [Scleroderma citrinum]
MHKTKFQTFLTIEAGTHLTEQGLFLWVELCYYMVIGKGTTEFSKVSKQSSKAGCNGGGILSTSLVVPPSFTSSSPFPSKLPLQYLAHLFVKGCHDGLNRRVSWITVAIAKIPDANHTESNLYSNIPILAVLGSLCHQSTNHGNAKLMAHENIYQAGPLGDLDQDAPKSFLGQYVTRVLNFQNWEPEGWVGWGIPIACDLVEGQWHMGSLHQMPNHGQCSYILK